MRASRDNHTHARYGCNHATGLRRTVREVSEIRLAGGATLLFLTAFGLHLAGAPTGATLPLYALCYAVGGWDPTVAGIEALRERRIDVDVLTVSRRSPPRRSGSGRTGPCSW